jgi:hypothetical protein
MIHFLRCFHDLLKPVQNCLFQCFPISTSYRRRLKRDLLGARGVLGVSRVREKKWDLLLWGIGCLFYLHVQSSCGYGEFDSCSNRFHIWCPCLRVGWILSRRRGCLFLCLSVLAFASGVYPVSCVGKERA